MRAPFSVVDYVQLACLGRHSVHIDMEFVKAAGKVIVWQGELWSASDEQGEGRKPSVDWRSASAIESA